MSGPNNAPDPGQAPAADRSPAVGIADPLADLPIESLDPEFSIELEDPDILEIAEFDSLCFGVDPEGK
jgi:hypothetical protein